MTPASWAAVLEAPEAGLRQLLAPLAQSAAGEAAIDLLAARALRATIKPVQLAPLNVEHPEQLTSASAGEVEALVVEVAGLTRTSELWVGEGFHRFGPISFGSATKTSVWELDEWKFESADDEVVEVLGECSCDLEINEYQWVVSNDAQQRYLATSRLHDDFSSSNQGDLEFEVLDAALPLGDLFLRATAGLMVPVAGKKVLFHQDVVITRARAYLPGDETKWAAEFDALLAEPFAIFKLAAFCRARAEARPWLLTAVASGHDDAFHAATELFSNEPEWVDALVSASTHVPLRYAVVGELKRRVSVPAARTRLEALFEKLPEVEQGWSARVFLELAHTLRRFDDPRVVAMVANWQAGTPLKDAEFAVRALLEGT